MSIFFDPEIFHSPIILALTAVAVVASLFLVIAYRHRIVMVSRHARACRTKDGQPSGGNLPPMSIVVYDLDSTDALSHLLGSLLTQDYPSPFEIIVATDGRSERANDLVGALAVEHNNLHLTYVPDEAHALSRKKLAITLGVKAAKHPFVVLTDANNIITSDHWLESFGRHFADGADVVAAVSTPVGRNNGRTMSTLREFDSLADTVAALSSSIAGKPYCAGENNVAFRRRIFFDVKGFASSVGLHHGIDDVFFYNISNGRRLDVELDPQAISHIASSNPSELHDTLRRRRFFTGRMVPRFARRLMGVSSLMMWLWLGATVAVGVIAAYNLLPLSIALAFGILWIVACSIAWNKVARLLIMPLRRWATPLLMFLRPLCTLRLRIGAMSRKSANYTWAKPR